MTLTASPARRTSAADARTLDVTEAHGSGDTAVRALDGMTVELPAGWFTAAVGPPGSGRFTLLHCVAGLDSVTSGHVARYAGRGRGRLSRRALGPPAAQAVA
jgi:putative ABC transport system ATP-binding protein